MKRFYLAVPAFVALVAWGCGSDTAPSTMPGAGNSGGSGGSVGSTTINAQFSNGLANLGANSFTPNPASASQGAMIVWHNNDSVTHHIVLDDGSLDTGNIAPGASSAAKPLNSAGATYHCSIHPSMVGSINMPTMAPAPGPAY